MFKINRTTFFAYIRKSPFGGRLSQLQLDGMNAILDAWAASGMVDLRWLAYMFATTFHETGATMQPVRETFATSDKQAIARLEKAWKAGRMPQVKTPYWRTGYFGRGLPQTTHLANYAKFKKLLGIDFVANPGLMLVMKNSIAVMFEGMTRGVSSKGDFTGKSLEDYFNETVDDPIGARKIINGKDKAKLISTYHNAFLDALNAAQATYIDDGRKTDHIADDVNPEDAKADDVKPSESKSLWTILTGMLAGGGLSINEALSGSSTVLQAVSNPWALIAVLSVVAAGVLIFLIATGRLRILRNREVA